MKPKAPPDLGMMLSLSTGLQEGTSMLTAVPTKAWPTSCLDTTDFSSPCNMLLFFSIPATVLNTAASKSSAPTAFWPLLPANRAASLTILAKSAPVNPVVCEASAETLKSLSRGRLLFSIWTLKICSLPILSGLSTGTRLSNLPGLNSAGSKTSGLLVAAMQITILDSEELKPSSSVKS